jgi:hypothetical protein
MNPISMIRNSHCDDLYNLDDLYKLDDLYDSPLEMHRKIDIFFFFLDMDSVIQGVNDTIVY